MKLKRFNKTLSQVLRENRYNNYENLPKQELFKRTQKIKEVKRGLGLHNLFTNFNQKSVFVLLKEFKISTSLKLPH